MDGKSDVERWMEWAQEKGMKRATKRDKWGELDGENLDGEKGRE
jgi:hypothetical protein